MFNTSINEKLSQHRIIWFPLSYLLASARTTSYYSYEYLAVNCPEIQNILVTGRNTAFPFKNSDIVIVMDKYAPLPDGEKESLWLWEFLTMLQGKVLKVVYLYVPEEDQNLQYFPGLVDAIIAFNSHTFSHLQATTVGLLSFLLTEPHNTSTYYRSRTKAENPNGSITIGFHGWEYPIPDLSHVLFEIQQQFQVRYLFITDEVYGQHSFLHPIQVIHRPWRLETVDRYMWETDIGFRPQKPGFLHKSSWSPLEWLKYKTPVIIDGNMPEYVKHFPKDWPSATTETEWYDAFSQLILDSQNRLQLGMQGYEYLDANFSVKLFVEKILDIICVLLSKK